jgi:hypothetical protein
MLADKCESIRSSIQRFLSEQTIIEAVGNLCVVTLPIPTVDGKLVDIFVEKKLGDLLLVHDAGKAANELIIHGVDITDSLDERCGLLAQSFNISWADETFQKICKSDYLNQAVMSVAACSSLALFNLVGHQALPDENPVRGQFGQVLKTWARGRAKIKEQVIVEGCSAQHTFDFVVQPKANGRPISVSILLPTGGSRAAAERFGFRVWDLQGKTEEKWKRLVVEVKSDMWSAKAKRIINQNADQVIEIETERKPVLSEISQAMATILEIA